jgi:solute carrier family 25 carnitine/acylcarnitine transporter 20/29
VKRIERADQADKAISVKTKVQQRALAGERYRGPFETLYRLIRGEAILFDFLSPIQIPVPGPDPKAPKPLVAGIARLYQGLGVSALRSITTHGLLWTFFDIVSNYIDGLPGGPER